MSPVYDISKEFKHKTLNTLSSPPTYESILTTHTELRTRTYSVCTILGGGLDGHLGIKMTYDNYLHKTSSKLVHPIDPGVIHKYGKNDSTSVLQNKQLIHQDLQTIFVLCDITYKVLKKTHRISRLPIHPNPL